VKWLNRNDVLSASPIQVFVDSIVTLPNLVGIRRGGRDVGAGKVVCGGGSGYYLYDI